MQSGETMLSSSAKSFDPHVAGLHVGRPAHNGEPLHRGLCGVRAHAALFRGTREHLSDEVARLLRGTRAAVGHEHVHTAAGGDLCNAAPHGAGTDYAYDEVRAIRIKVH